MLGLLALAFAAGPLQAQDRPSARLAGLNVNLAGTLLDPWTDAWRSPARWSRSPAAYALFRRGASGAPDIVEAAVVAVPSPRHGLAARVAGEPDDSAADRSYAASLTAGLATAGASLGARFDAAYEEGRTPSPWGFAAAAGFQAAAKIGSVEIWGEFQRPPSDPRVEGFAGEVVLASPDPRTAQERLEPVIVGRAGRHRGDRFGLTARGPVTWYEASFGLRRRWGTAGAFGVAIRRGEWRARSACETGDTVCAAVVDPTVGNHPATAMDAALELRFAASLWLRAGGSWALDGSPEGYEEPWPRELRTVGALRPGTVRGAFFGVAFRLAPRITLDAYGYPGPLKSRGANRRVGRFGIQLWMAF